MDSERVRPALAPTGDPRVDEAVAGLASLDDLDLAERPAVLADVHGRLREILGELGEPGQGAAAPSRPGEPGRPGQQGELDGSSSPRPGPPAPGSWPRPGSWEAKPNG